MGASANTERTGCAAVQSAAVEDTLRFYEGRRVFVTGHTGFKGAWLCEILLGAGAKVCGYALEPPTEPSLYEILGLEARMESHIGDIRDFARLRAVFGEFRPQVVFHLAAQPIVRASYEDPRLTFETNVMGTVNALECVRVGRGVESFLNVTTDKVYLNRERSEGYREDEQLDGFDPYSNSKSCSELVTHSYARSFFAQPGGTPVSTARAGNVIGGGDFARDRIIPDCVRAALSGKPLEVRNPRSVRPYQHVLEPLFAYLTIAARQAFDASLAGWYNVGPDECDCVDTAHIADTFSRLWAEGGGEGKARFSWVDCSDAQKGAVHEAGFLKLDCTKLKSVFGWRPVWNIDEAISKTVDWTREWASGGDVLALTRSQIAAYASAAQSFDA